MSPSALDPTASGMSGLTGPGVFFQNFGFANEGDQALGVLV